MSLSHFIKSPKFIFSLIIGQNEPKRALIHGLCTRIKKYQRELRHQKFVKYSAISSGFYIQQPSPLLYSIDIWPAHSSRLTQRETNHYIARCASVLAWSYIAERSPTQLVVDLFAKHQRYVVHKLC